MEIARTGRRENSAVRIRWPVATEGYRWSTAHEPFMMLSWDLPGEIKRAPQGPWLLEPGRQGAEYMARHYEPLRWHRNLHVEFAHLPLEGAEAMAKIAAFASRYGLLGIERATLAVSAPANASEEPDMGLYEGEHLVTWQRAIRRVAGLLELIEACGRDDTELLRTYVRWRGSPLSVKLFYTWPGTERPSSTTIASKEPPLELSQIERWATSTRDHDRYVAPVRHYLFREINMLLSEHVTPRLIDGHGIILGCDSLFGAFCVMLAEQLGGTWRMNVCRNCGKLFLPRSRSDQKTCSDACRKRWSRVGKQKPGGSA